VYSYDIARQLFPGVRPDLLRATSSYQAKDELTLDWRAVPGYRDPTYAANYFLPLPEHAWGSLPAAELATAEISARMPVGWGPYQIEEWKAGDHITLRKNDRYFRGADGRPAFDRLPVFDRLVYRFVNGSQEGLAALLAGECDILDVPALDGASQAELSGLQEAGRIRIVTEPDTAWDQLLFGIQPLDAVQPAFFQTKEVRQGIAQCIDRQALRSRLGVAQEQGMNTYVPSDHPLYNPDIKQYAYDPQAAANGLQAAGWLDADSDPTTPRISQGAAGVPDGTPFTVELLSLQDDRRKLAAEAIKESLAQCGVQVNIRYLTPDELFAPGPGGPVFGRNFQLAQFGWDLSLEPACYLYTTEEIPGPPPGAFKGWGGANAGGFSNAEFDRACSLARTSLPEDPLHAEAHRQAQAIFAEELPALPLYAHSRMVVTRPDLCGLSLDGSSQSILWNLEALNYGEACPAD
jgi:peptide/nickel transport system substrate-binding protein